MYQFGQALGLCKNLFFPGQVFSGFYHCFFPPTGKKPTDTEWHRRGHQHLLSKVRILMGRIGIHVFDKSVLAFDRILVFTKQVFFTRNETWEVEDKFHSY